MKELIMQLRKTEEINKQPIILDLHISYEPIKDLIIKAGSTKPTR